MKKLKLFEMFAGFGGASFALKKLGVDFECIGYSEIDKFACQCYNQNHWINMPKTNPQFDEEFDHNFGDCTKINPIDLPDFDILTGGFPCQTFSVAGKGKGELDARGTLFYEIIRIAEVKKPKMMLLENVKGLTNKKHKATFEKILSELDRIGYNVRWQVLNTKNHGIPQNRDRVFFVCFLKGNVNWFDFKFPKEEELKIFLKDILEEDVDEKYFLSDKMVEKITFKEKSNGEVANLNKGGERGSVYSENTEVMSCLSATDYKQPKQIIIQTGMIKQICKKRMFETPKEINEFLRNNKGSLTIKEISEFVKLPTTQVEHYFRVDKSRAIPSPKVWGELKDLIGFPNTYDKQVTEIYEKEIEFESTRRVYSDNGISPTISATNADKIIQINNPKHSNDRIYNPCGISPTLNTMQGGRRQPFILQRARGFNKGGLKEICPSISSSFWQQNNFVFEDFRVRRLTPKECFRLMGFLDDGINLDGLSNTQRYKLAGNGWDINLVSKILKNMLVNFNEM